MSHIDIRHDHARTPEQARLAVEHLADTLATRFGMNYAWHGERLDFDGAGVTGSIDLLPRQLHVTANLGFLLLAMKTPIEAEIRRVLRERFD